jgi:hypothetical protein
LNDSEGEIEKAAAGDNGFWGKRKGIESFF